MHQLFIQIIVQFKRKTKRKICFSWLSSLSIRLPRIFLNVFLYLLTRFLLILWYWILVHVWLFLLSMKTQKLFQLGNFRLRCKRVILLNWYIIKSIWVFLPIFLIVHFTRSFSKIFLWFKIKTEILIFREIRIIIFHWFSVNFTTFRNPSGHIEINCDEKSEKESVFKYGQINKDLKFNNWLT